MLKLTQRENRAVFAIQKELFVYKKRIIFDIMK